ncbi:MAG: T9SS type A sorting domain-containing protein [Marinirhabdus sp.]
MDGDNDVDIVTTSFDLDSVIWFENLNGTGNFGDQRIISNTILFAYALHTADLDNDSDLDIVVTPEQSDSLFMFTNLDGLGNFGATQTIASILTNGRAVKAADIDGDKDILTSFNENNSIAWFENDGQGNFATVNFVSNDTSGVETFDVADIDGDGDLDVIIGISSLNTIRWYENLNGTGNFGAAKLISAGADFVRAIHAVDADNDTDIDIISANALSDELTWFENESGTGNFGPKKLIGPMENSRTIFAADLDGDGDQDVLSGSREVSANDTVVWFPNQTVLSVYENPLEKITVFPNPVDDLLYIRSLVPILQIKFFDITGKEVLSCKNVQQNVDVSQLSSGTYIVEIHTVSGSIRKKFVKQ